MANLYGALDVLARDAGESPSVRAAATATATAIVASVEPSWRRSATALMIAARTVELASERIVDADDSVRASAASALGELIGLEQLVVDLDGSAQDGSQDDSASPLARRVAGAWGGALRRCAQCVGAAPALIATQRAPEAVAAARRLAALALDVLQRGAAFPALAVAYAAAAYGDAYDGDHSADGGALRDAHSALLDGALASGWTTPAAADETGALQAKAEVRAATPRCAALHCSCIATC